MSSAANEVSWNSLKLARMYSEQKNFARAFSHYLVHGTLRQGQIDSKDSASSTEVLSTLRNLADRLEAKGHLDEIREAYRQCLILLPQCFELHFDFGLRLIKDEDLNEAKSHLEKAVALKPDSLIARHHFYSVLVSLLERWHFPMLNDEARNVSYRKAIELTIEDFSAKQQREGRQQDLVVLDVGTGSGILALFASDSASKVKKKVFACEISPAMAETSAEVFKMNKKEVKLIQKLSTQLNDRDLNNQPVDVFITETFDAGLFGEHVLETLDHAWKHLLHQGSRIIPCKAKVFAVPIDSAQVRNQTYLHRPSIGQLQVNDLLVKSEWVRDEPYNCDNLDRTAGFLSEPQEMFSIDFEDSAQVEEALRTSRTINLEFQLTESGLVSGVALWFQLILDRDETIVIDTKPGSLHCWDQAIYPVIPFEDSQQNDVINVTFELKEHFKLKSCKNISKKVVERGPDRKIELFLPVDYVCRLNDLTSATLLQRLSFNISREKFNCKTLDILDATFVCDISLQIMLVNQRSHLTVFMCQNSATSKSRIDFVSELADVNHIALNRIDCSSFDEDTVARENYDLVFFEPILSSGKLDPQVWTDLLPKLSRFQNKPTLFPWRVSVYCLLVESEALMKKSLLINDSSCCGYQISKAVNKYSVKHQQDLTLSTLEYKTLTEPTYVHSFDFRDFDPSSDVVQTQSAFAKLTDAGIVHAVVYWFVLEYGWDINLSTLEGSFKQAAILVEPIPVTPASNDTVSLLLHHQQGILDFEIHC